MTPTAIEDAAGELSAGRPVVVPFPSPLPYGIAAADSAAANEVKGRPADQAVGIALAGLAELRPYLDLDEQTCQLAEWASRVQKLSLLLPVADTVPVWLAPAVVDGLAAVTLVWLPELRALLQQFGHLYISSANRTAREVATTAATANREFEDSLLVLDGDPMRDAGARSGSATIVRFGPDLTLRVFRSGINTEGCPHEQGYLDGLVRAWQTGAES